MHPYERIEVSYNRPARPERIVEERFVLNEGDTFRGCSHTFVDGVDLWTVDVDAQFGGWGNIVKWSEQTSKWKAANEHHDPEQFDAIQVAHLRREKLFGAPHGVESTVHLKFQGWLIDNGWRPIMLDLLNAYSTGLVLAEGGVYRSHVLGKGDRYVYMQYSFGSFRFVFELSDHPGTFQVPVDEALFDDAVNGKLGNLEELITRTNQPHEQ